MPRACCVAAAAAILAVVPCGVSAQDAPAPQHDAMPGMQHEGGMTLFPSREASGTSWLPQDTPMYGYHLSSRGWQGMLHFNGFLEYLADGGSRGTQDAASVNWLMVMARHEVGAGRVGVRGMFSAEPWTVPGCGYADLFASGERCGGRVNHDVQHPHDLFMELAAEYVQPLTATTNWQIYGGPAGEPALGPTAFPHRPSAMANPVAPISHHWLDSTHVSFGVVTSGVYTARWKIEGSVFNGREPDERRTTIDLARLDSYSARVWLTPGTRWALQVSAGHLAQAEETDAPGEREDVERVTASATYHRATGADRLWATTAAWGANREGGRTTQALLLETSADLTARDTWYGRIEVNGKTAADLAVEPRADVFTLMKVQAGYTRSGREVHGLVPGIGISASAAVAPSSLAPDYGGRVSYGAAVYLTIRPAGHRM